VKAAVQAAIGESFNQFQKVFMEWSLQRFCLRPWCGKPGVDLCGLGQDHWHRIGVDRRDNTVRLAGQESKEIVGGLAVLQLADAGPAGHPDPREERRAITFHPEPGIASALARPGFGEANQRHQPAPPMGRVGVAHVGDAPVDAALGVILRRGGHAPARAAQDAPRLLAGSSGALQSV